MIPPEVERRAQAVLAARGSGFARLSAIAGFDPAVHWRGADLHHADFGSDDLAGFNFENADLSFANFSRARGLSADMFKGVICEGTVWPPAWHAGQEGWADNWGVDQYGSWASFSVRPARGKRVVQRLRWIPPGRFPMGSPEDEAGRFDDEGPRHLVTLKAGFWLFDTPCTQALWRAVMGGNPSYFTSPTRPVERVDFEMVTDFIGKLNGFSPKLRLSLPSEAQWEYACRAGTETATYAGLLAILGENNAPVLDPIAWYGGNSGVDFDLKNGIDSSDWPDKQHEHTRAGTRKVGLKRPNEWGLYDMLGNVDEWCADHWHDSYTGAPTDGRAWIEAGGLADRVIRGGCWRLEARNVRAAYRNGYDPTYRYVLLGFRCARVQRSGATAEGGEEQAQGAERPAATTSPQRARSEAGPAKPRKRA